MSSNLYKFNTYCSFSEARTQPEPKLVSWMHMTPKLNYNVVYNFQKACDIFLKYVKKMLSTRASGIFNMFLRHLITGRATSQEFYIFGNRFLYWGLSFADKFDMDPKSSIKKCKCTVHHFFEITQRLSVLWRLVSNLFTFKLSYYFEIQ